MENQERMPPQGDEHYDYYPLDASDGTALLPEGQELVVQRASGHILLIDWEVRVVKAEATFDERECLLLRMLLEAWPASVPYERFLTHLTHYTVADLARRIEQVRTTDLLFPVIQPAQAVLRACQERLQVFGLSLVAVYQHGYLLMRWQEQEEVLPEI